MKQGMRWLAVAGVLTLVAAACSNNTTTAEVGAPEVEVAPPVRRRSTRSGPGRAS